MYILEPLKPSYSKLTVLIHDSTSVLSKNLEKSSIELYPMPSSFDFIPERVFVPISLDNTPDTLSAQKFGFLGKKVVLLSENYPTASRWGALIGDKIKSYFVEYI